MHTRLDLDAATGPSYVSTGRLPSPEQIRPWWRRRTSATRSMVTARARRCTRRWPGCQAAVGICVVGTSGNVYAVGDADYEFTIMSVSKPFVFALVCEALGPEAGRARKSG